MSDHPTPLVVTTTVNGDERRFLCEPHETLVDALRGPLELTGTKVGCGNGNCGACSVLLDGVVVNACLVLAAEVEGRRIETVEGLAPDDGLAPLQDAFLEHAALQCGICTPGILVSATALLAENPTPTEAEVRFWLAGNLCRCTGYDKIVRAVLACANGAASPPARTPADAG